jgi:hypothetical protein
MAQETKSEPDVPSEDNNSSGLSVAQQAMLEAQKKSDVPEAEQILYAPGERLIVENGKWEIYQGAGLVTADGKVADRGDGPFYYDIRNEPGIVWSSKSPQDRYLLMEQLVTAGFLSSSSIDDYSSQINAISQWLQASNFTGLEKDNFLKNQIAGKPINPQVGAGGPARQYVVSSPAELKIIAKRVSQETLGRELNDDDIAKFIKAYQSQELEAQRSSGTISRVPGADVAAQEFSQELDPTEANAYKYLGYVDKFFNSIGGVS